MLGTHHSGHEGVAHHEVGGRGVLVDKQRAASRLNRLDGAGRLGGGAARVERAEAGRVAPVGQVVNEQGDVHLVDCTAVLGTQLHGRGIARDILAPVTCHMVVHPFLQGL